MIRELVALAAAGVMVMGCVAQNPNGTTTLEVKPSEAQAAREFRLWVTGPADLAQNGRISSGDVSGVISTGGGNVISTGGGNVISTGGGNFTGAPRFHVASEETASMSAGRFAIVTGAGVVLEELDGTRLAGTFTTDANGETRLTGVPAGKALSAIALFSVGAKTYRLAVAVPTTSRSGALVADPINTFVEARVRELLLASGKSSAVTLEKLDEVWTVFNQAGITVEPADLETGKPLEALTAVYTRAIAELETREKAGDATAKDGIKTIKDYMATLR